MIRGLARFKEHFAAYLDQYALIGGTACALVMEDVGLDFRATKDLDIVLYIEAIDRQFVLAFWEFIKIGGYQNRQRSSGEKIFYRFCSPTRDDFPVMLELFSRIADDVKIDDDGHLTPIRLDEAATSLSAILLDSDYYQFIHTGRCDLNGLSVVKASHLIPLKARAWIDLNGRQKQGANIDDKDLRKHKNDIIRLYQLLSFSSRISLPETIRQDMQQFLDLFKLDNSINMKQLGLKNTRFEEILSNLILIYGLDH